MVPFLIHIFPIIPSHTSVEEPLCTHLENKANYIFLQNLCFILDKKRLFSLMKKFCDKRTARLIKCLRRMGLWSFCCQGLMLSALCSVMWLEEYSVSQDCCVRWAMVCSALYDYCVSWAWACHKTEHFICSVFYENCLSRGWVCSMS